MKKYLVITDVSSEPYTMDETLFAICDTKEDAIKWIRDHQKIKVPFSYRRGKFDFKKGMFRDSDWDDDERVYDMYVKEFDGEPMLVAAYCE